MSKYTQNLRMLAGYLFVGLALTVLAGSYTRSDPNLEKYCRSHGTELGLPRDNLSPTFKYNAGFPLNQHVTELRAVYQPDSYPVTKNTHTFCSANMTYEYTDYIAMAVNFAFWTVAGFAIIKLLESNKRRKK